MGEPKESMKEKYTHMFLEPFKSISSNTVYKPIWLTMNRECEEFVRPEFPAQKRAVDAANELAISYLRENNVRYMNIDALIPEDYVCELMDPECGGVHTKWWVDHVRATVLLSSLCTREGHWR